MRIIMSILSILLAGNVFALSYESDFPSIAGNVATNKYFARIVETNRLAQLIGSTTNATQLAACRLVKSVLLLDAAEEELSDDAFAEATNLCTMVESDFAANLDSWPYFVARYISIGALSLDRRHEDAFSMATNTLSAYDSHVPVSIDTNVWVAIAMHDMQTNVSIRTALRAEASLSLAVQGRGAEIHAYTNGLPRKMLDAVVDCLGQGGK